MGVDAAGVAAAATGVPIGVPDREAGVPAGLAATADGLTEAATGAPVTPRPIEEGVTAACVGGGAATRVGVAAAVGTGLAAEPGLEADPAAPPPSFSKTLFRRLIIFFFIRTGRCTPCSL